MNKGTEYQNRGASTTRTLLVVASLGVNLFLAVWLWRHESARASTPGQSARNFDAPSHHAPATSPTKSSAVTAVETNLPVPFHWSEIESSDYRRYIANLRAIGCPEQTIRDIILADVGQLFGARAAAIWQPKAWEYWKKNKYEPPDPASGKQRIALAKEHDAVLRELIGDTRGMQGLIDTLYLQVHGSEQELLFLPPDKREAAVNFLSESDFDTRVEELHSRGYGPSDEKKLFEDKVKALADVLSPEELEEFRMRNSPTAKHLQMELEYFNCTPDEFKKLVALRDQDPNGESIGGDMIDRTAAAAEVRDLLGDERAKEFERVTDMFYINARQPAEKQGIALDQIEQAWQVTRDARTSAKRIANDNTLAVDERRRQVQELLQQSESQLVNLLGEKASTAVRRDLRNVVNATRNGIH